MDVLVIRNLRAGSGDAGFYEFVHELGNHGAEVTMRFLHAGSDMAHLLRDAPSFDRVVSAGGDGTASAVAYALRGTGIPVLAYPAGTANLLARNLRLPAEPSLLAEALVDGRTVAIDLGELSVSDANTGGEPIFGFVVAAGAGFDARIMEAAEPLKPALGEGAYILAALQNLNLPVSRFTLELEDTVVRTEGIAVLVMNLARIQFDIAVTHGSDARDGLFEVVVLNTSHPARLLPAIWAALLDRLQPHPERPGLEVYTASSVRVTADPPLPVEYDGDVVTGGSTPLVARVLPKAGTFIISEEDPFPHDASA